jgi:predicted acetyltransferase
MSTHAGARLTFRTATADDLDRLVDLHSTAFPDPRGREARVRNFTANPMGGFEHLWVAVDEGAVVAHGFLFPLAAWFSGALVRFGGIASVGVAPEARGRGVGSALVEHLGTVSLERGEVLTVLYPFRQAFYARLGFATTSPYRRLRFSPNAIPFRPQLSARAARGTDRAALRACWVAVAGRGTGRLDRSERLWNALLSDERRTWLVVEGDGEVRGYIAWMVRQAEPHGETVLRVCEMVAKDDVAERTLWGLVGAQRGQVDEVRIDVAEDDPAVAALVDADARRPGTAEVNHVLGELAGGPMLRIGDPVRALAARGWQADLGAFGHEQPHLVLNVSGQRLELTRCEGRTLVAPTVAEPAFSLDLPTLAAIAFGALRPSHAARLGWLSPTRTSSVLARDLARADAMFALPAYFSPDPF